MSLHRFTPRLALLAALTSLSISATPIRDPEMALDTSATGSTPVGLEFNFTASSNGGGILPFTNPPYRNASGQDWTSLNVTSDFPFAGNTFECYGGPYFARCAVTPDASGFAQVSFFGVGFLVGDPPNDQLIHLYPGITKGLEFRINLNQPLDNPVGDSGGWLIDGRPASFQALAHTEMPEPGTVALVAAGLGALAFRRRQARLGRAPGVRC